MPVEMPLSFRRASVVRLLVLVLAAALAFGPGAQPAIALDLLAAPSSDAIPEHKRSKAGRYVTAAAAARAASSSRDVLLIDIRTPEETAFGGLPALVTRHIPYILIDETLDFDEKAGRYRLVVNPEFGKAIELLIKERGLDRKAVLVLLCSVGDRSRAAANYLFDIGYPNVTVMLGGTDGDPTLGAIGSGWREQGLPWAERMRADQAYRSPSL